MSISLVKYFLVIGKILIASVIGPCPIIEACTRLPAPLGGWHGSGPAGSAAVANEYEHRGYAPLYIQLDDRHYDAMTQRVTYDKSVPTSVRIGEYQVQFECKPWLIRDTAHTLTGTGTIDTDQVTRTIADGGWTPTTITVTGTNVTISGYTVNGDFAGFISVSGAVTNLIIDSDAMTATIGGANKNNVMRWADYKMQVGPDKTFFTTTGASSMTVVYHDRWYL